jgi:hypothetical protein
MKVYIPSPLLELSSRKDSSKPEWFILYDLMNITHVYAILLIEVIRDLGLYLRQVWVHPSLWSLPHLSMACNFNALFLQNDFFLWNKDQGENTNGMGRMITHTFESELHILDTEKKMISQLRDIRDPGVEINIRSRIHELSQRKKGFKLFNPHLVGFFFPSQPELIQKVVKYLP